MAVTGRSGEPTSLIVHPSTGPATGGPLHPTASFCTSSTEQPDNITARQQLVGQRENTEGEWGVPRKETIRVVTRGNVQLYTARNARPRIARTIFECGRFNRLQNPTSNPLDTFLYVWGPTVTDRFTLAPRGRGGKHRGQKRKRQRTPGESQPMRHGSASTPLTRSELMHYFGIRLLAGQVQLIKEEDIWDDVWWERLGQMRVAMKNAMTKDRYQEIRQKMQYTEPIDEDGSEEDRSLQARVEWLGKSVFGNSMDLRPPSTNLVYDDQSFRYYGRTKLKRGRHSGRRDKTDPVAMEYDALNDEHGMTLSLRSRKREASDERARGEGGDEMKVGILGRRIIETLFETLNDPTGYHITTDRGYTTYDLLSELNAHGVKATGTVNKRWLKHSSPELKETPAATVPKGM